MAYVSLKTIADQVGVSMQTVSRALRGERYVRPELKERIQAIADALGYRPDPRVKALLGHMRQRNEERRSETMALILPGDTEAFARGYYYMRTIIEGAKACAARLGFGFEVHSMVDEGREAMERVLWARGIELLIIAPVTGGIRPGFSLHWERYAAVLIGPGIWRPRLNRVLPNYYLNMIHLLRHLKKLGYRRPALVIREAVLARAGGAIEAGFRQNAAILGVDDAERRVWRKPTKELIDDYRRWLKTLAVDVVISDGWGALPAGLGLRMPDDIGYAAFPCDPDDLNISGMNIRTDLLGAHAVELLAGHFYRNERGIPRDPTIIMHEGTWNPGKTLRLQRHGAPDPSN